MSAATDSARVSAVVLLDALVQLGVTHLVGLPDNGSAALFELAASDPRVGLLTVTREGEAVAVASGLWLGGGQPVVLMQNTGLLESGDALRGTAFRMGVPLLLLIGVRGRAKLEAHAAEIRAARDTPADMSHIMKRADIDSVAVITESTLSAWNVPHVVYAADEDVDSLAAAAARARAEMRPHAVLLPQALS